MPLVLRLALPIPLALTLARGLSSALPVARPPALRSPSPGDCHAGAHPQASGCMGGRHERGTPNSTHGGGATASVAMDRGCA